MDSNVGQIVAGMMYVHISNVDQMVPDPNGDRLALNEGPSGQTYLCLPRSAAGLTLIVEYKP